MCSAVSCSSIENPAKRFEIEEEEQWSELGLPSQREAKRCGTCSDELAIEVGFEPTEDFSSPVFRTGTLNLSDTLPNITESIILQAQLKISPLDQKNEI